MNKISKTGLKLILFIMLTNLSILSICIISIKYFNLSDMNLLVLSLVILILILLISTIVISRILRPVRIIKNKFGSLISDDYIYKQRIKEIDSYSGRDFDGLISSLNSFINISNREYWRINGLICNIYVQKKMFPLDLDSRGACRKLATGSYTDEQIQIFSYYQEARDISDDYFDYRHIDDEHIAVIKGNIGVRNEQVTSFLVQIITLTIFKEFHFRKKESDESFNLEELVESINSHVENLKLHKVFNSFIVSVINKRTGMISFCNAGDNYVPFYNTRNDDVSTINLSRTPASGPFFNELVNQQGGFKQEDYCFNIGDILFLYTDGLDESQRTLRNEELKRVQCEGCDFSAEQGSHPSRDTDTHFVDSDFEEFGLLRISNILKSIVSGRRYELVKHHNPFPEKPLTFDFSDCQNTAQDSVIGVMAVEKIYRLFPDPSAGADDRILLDRKIDAFLQEHFDQYSDYFKYPEDHPDLSDYVYYSHLKEDDQYGDFTFLAIKLNPGESLEPYDVQEMSQKIISRHNKRSHEIIEELKPYCGKPVDVEILDGSQSGIEELKDLDEESLVDAEINREDGNESNSNN